MSADPDQTTRAEGFYWVRLCRVPDEEVAHWFNGHWWATGNSAPFTEDEVEVISERLERPHA